MKKNHYYSNSKITIKWFLFFLLLFVFFSKSTFAQTLYAADCNRVNNFSKTSRIDNIKPLVMQVLNTGSLILREYEDNLDLIFDEMELDGRITFVEEDEIRSKLDTNKSYIHFQQYYSGVKVENGGYTLGKVKPGGPMTPVGPCGPKYFMMIPFIIDDITISTTPTISAPSLLTILNTASLASYELVITTNLTQNCANNLAYKVTHKTSTKTIVTYVNGLGGAIIKSDTFEYDENTAPTLIYPLNTTSKNVTFDNYKSGNNWYLISHDYATSPEIVGLFVRDFNTTPAEPSDSWALNLIPTTTSSTWTVQAPLRTYQTFYTADKVRDTYRTFLGHIFKRVYIGSSAVYNSLSYPTNNLTESVFSIGFDDLAETIHGSQFDIIAHEMGHARMNEIFKSAGQLGARTLHEAMADMFGAYIESKIQGYVDWTHGDDGGDPDSRNLQSPPSNRDCFTEVSSNTTPHYRGQPLGHWFYLISAGSTNIPALGIDFAMNLIEDALATKKINSSSDYATLAGITLAIALNYGRCSNEFLSVANAWERICIPTGYTNNGVVSCQFSILGYQTICIEDLTVEFCINGQVGDDFFWHINGDYDTYFETEIGLSGNGQTGGHCFTVTYIPTFLDYLPQEYVISASSLSDSFPFLVATHKFRIIDCGTKNYPTCEEYYNLSRVANNANDPVFDNLKKTKDSNSDVIEVGDALIESNNKMRIYDYMGKIIYDGNVMDYKIGNISYNGFGIIVVLDKTGKPIRTQKGVFFK